MQNKSDLDNLIIRTAVVRQKDVGYIFACDPKKEKEDVPHTITFRWNAGVFNKGDRNYDAHSAAVISNPEPALVDISGAGYYSVITKKGMVSGDIVDDSNPPSVSKRIGGFRSVAEIAGKAYAVGLRGMVYRFDNIKQWTRIDEGLPDTFNAQAIHGYDESDIYAVGREGNVWHFDGKKWFKCDVPTNLNLTAVKCAGNGTVYIAGYNGLLIFGRNNAWEVMVQEEMQEDIWDLEWFNNCLFISTLKAVYFLNNKIIEKVDFAHDSPKTTYQLSVGQDIMWSNGEHDIMAYDGKKWTKIV